MDTGPKTMGELREHLIEKATIDEKFRAQFIADPKAAIKDELGVALPDGYTIEVHEDAADVSHMVLPPPAALAESELAAAAGGSVKAWNAVDRTYVSIDNVISFWDDYGGTTYHGGPRHNAS